MFIKPGAPRLLLEGERQKFLSEEWPRISATIERLGLKVAELLNGQTAQPSSDPAASKTSKTPEEKG